MKQIDRLSFSMSGFVVTKKSKGTTGTGFGELVHLFFSVMAAKSMRFAVLSSEHISIHFTDRVSELNKHSFPSIC